MVLDTSAIVAAILQEPESDRFRQAMRGAGILAMSSITVLETRIVLLNRLGLVAVRRFDQMIGNSGIVVAPFDGLLADAAFDAFQRFGKGMDHPAQLNIIGCSAYALAKIRAEPLLYQNDGFAHTDVDSAM